MRKKLMQRRCSRRNAACHAWRFRCKPQHFSMALLNLKNIKRRVDCDASAASMRGLAWGCLESVFPAAHHLHLEHE
jgi:hypothetical protein